MALILSGVCVWPAGAVQAGPVSDRLGYQSADGQRWVQALLTGELTGYQADEPAPAIIIDANGSFLQPRLALLIDAGISQGFAAHVQVTVDRGLDPGYRRNGQLRFDEYFLQADVLEPIRGQVRMGRFSTALGGWVSRHRAIDNPLISAPLLYEDMVTITDATVPTDVDAFVSRRNVPENKPAWLPVIWGPSYATGVSFSASAGDFDFIIEAKNAGIASRPAVWDAIDTGWNTDPTWTGRISWHPVPGFTAGISHSTGPYLRARAERLLPSGESVDRFDQDTTAIDLNWERRRIQIWVEALHAAFDVPNAGRVRMTGAFAEVRWKFAPSWWIAGRVNRSVFGDAPGRSLSWDRDLTRFDAGLGWRIGADLQIKAEYSRGSQSGADVMGREVLALQAVYSF